MPAKLGIKEEDREASNNPPLPGTTGWGFIMARFEMTSPEMGSMAEMQPNAEGLFNLGIVYATGLDGEADLVAAHKWFNLAALRGNPEAAYHRQQIAEELSESDIAAAQRAAREWLRTH